MQQPRRKSTRALVIASIAVLALVAGAVAFVRAGIYNVGADDPHLPVTYALLEQLREASIHARASKLEVPEDLMSPARVIQGAGNYDAMCTQCHLAPGMQPTEISRGLYPTPPNLTRETVGAAEAFWVIKHGIKASGMPAWGGSMDDEYIWNMAAFIQQLPNLDVAGYRAMVAQSGGHSHGGGETMPHGHGGMTDADHPHEPGTPLHDEAPTAPTAPATHSHAPGTPPHDDAPAMPATHSHAPGTPPHDDHAPNKADHVDPPGAPAHTH